MAQTVARRKAVAARIKHQFDCDGLARLHGLWLVNPLPGMAQTQFRNAATALTFRCMNISAAGINLPSATYRRVEEERP